MRCPLTPLWIRGDVALELLVQWRRKGRSLVALLQSRDIVDGQDWFKSPRMRRWGEKQLSIIPMGSSLTLLRKRH